MNGDGEKTPMDIPDDDTDLPRQWCEVCQAYHLPLEFEGCDPLKAPTKPAAKPRASRKRKAATAVK